MSSDAATQFSSLFPLVPASRVSELLAACGGELERAIDRHLSAQEKGGATTGKPATKAPTERVVEEILDSDDDVVESRVATASKLHSAASSLAGEKRRAPASSSSPSSRSCAARAKKAKTGKNGTGANEPSVASFFQKSPCAPTPPPPPPPQPRPGASRPTAASRRQMERKLDEVTRPTVTAPSMASSHAVAASSSPVASAAAPAAASSSPTDKLPAAVDSTDPLQPCFRHGEPVPFLFLARIYALIEVENGRLKNIDYLTYLFWQILAFSPEDLAAALFLSSDQLAPSYENHQTGVGMRMLTTLVSSMTGVSHARLSADHASLGDLGLIAAQYQHTQSLLLRPPPLTVAKVFSSFRSLHTISARDKKEAVLRRMLTASRESELIYLIRIAEGGLRIGAVLTTVLTALAKAFVLNHLYTEGVPVESRHQVCTFERVSKATAAVRGVKVDRSQPLVLDPITDDGDNEATASPASTMAAVHRRLPAYLACGTARVRRAYAELPSFHAILPVLMRSPTSIYELHKHIRLTAGVPIKPQLGRPMKSIMQVMALFKGVPFTVEVKYDGLRAQIHRLPNGTYRIFSRHLMDQADRWSDLEPFIESAIRNPADVQSFILDAEIVAVDHIKEAAANSDRPAAAAADDDTTGAAPSGEPSTTFRILPFQQLSTRKRGSTSGAAAASSTTTRVSSRPEVSCMVYVFDFLSLNGRSLLLENLPTRRALARNTFNECAGRFQFVEHVDISAESTQDLSLEEVEENEETTRAAEQKTTKAAQRAQKPAAVRTAAVELDLSSDEEENEDSTHLLGEDDELDAALMVADETAANDVDDSHDERKSPHPGHEGDAPLLPPSAASAAASVLPPPSASDQISSFLQTLAIVRGEGIMAKSLSSRSTYEPDVRTDQWCKLKKDYIAGFGIADSIDVCIIGAWWGNGRKRSWMSPFLAAVYNAETEMYESFAKVMSGFSDDVYRQLTAECQALVIPHPKKYYHVHESLTPTMWFEPVKVWEIRGADLTISPVHSAGIGIVHPHKVSEAEEHAHGTHSASLD